MSFFGSERMAAWPPEPQQSQGAVYVYSNDRTEVNWLRWWDEVPDWAQTKFHRCRPTDHGLAACSSRIILNCEGPHPVGSVPPSELCRRCFPRKASA